MKALAAAGDDRAKAGLRLIGRANPEGGAADYEVKRKALQALAALGQLASLPPVSRAHAREILKRLSADKPQAAVFDYDDTLEENQAEASPDTARGLRAAADAGVAVMILTARSDRAEDRTGATIQDSLRSLSPGQKEGLLVGSNRGSRLLVFDAKGGARLVYAAPVWTEGERSSVDAAISAVAAVYAPRGKIAPLPVRQATGYSLSFDFPAGGGPARVAAAAELLRAELVRRSVSATVEGRASANARRRPYLVVNKFDKSHGVRLLRGNRDLYARIRGVVRTLPPWLQGLGIKLAGLLPRTAVPESGTLVVGDHFFGGRADDLDMHKAAPGGLALAVGGTADPRAENVFVWPGRGRAAAREILGALARKGPHDGGGP